MILLHLINDGSDLLLPSFNVDSYYSLSDADIMLISNNKLASIKRVFKEPPPIKGTSRAELLGPHMEKLKEELVCICMDFLH
jgi:hypothetical protein